MPLKPPWNYVNVRLEQVAHTARKAAEVIYRRELGLDTFQIRILRIVHTKGFQPVSEIAKMANLDRTFVSRMISRLVRAGLLERTIAEDDARKFLPKLTPAGQRLVHRANRLGDGLNKDLLSVLNSREQEYLEACLAKLSKWRPKDPV
jgi:MarR family transcriptional regulator, temperature-dependent positive regulator of motility